MSHRFGPPLITGAHIHGNSGLGVLAELVPSTGEHGAGYLYASLEFPADSGKEVRGLITTWPTLGTLTAFEDSSFEYDGASDSFAFQMYVDGQPVGTPQTVMVLVGAQVSITAVTASSITQTGATITVSRSNPAAGTQYFVIVPQGVTPTWSRNNVATNSGWAATTIAYHDADTDPGSGTTYVFTPDASGLTASAAYDLWAVWDDGATTVGPVQGTGFTAAAAGIAPSGGQVTVNGYTATVSQPLTVSPAAARVTAHGYAPGVDQSARVSPSSGEILVRGYVAGIAQPRTISLLAGRSSLRGYVPGVQQLSSTYSITLEQVRLLYSIYRLHGLAEPLNTSPTSREVASLLQSVSSAGASTVVETSSLPSDVPADPGLLIEELAALHGLTTPLTVTATSRTAGTIVQSFSAVGSSITVTRQ